MLFFFFFFPLADQTLILFQACDAIYWPMQNCLYRNFHQFPSYMGCVNPCPADPGYNLPLQTVQIQISWLLKKPTDLDLHCLSLNLWMSIKYPDQVIWLAKWAWHLNLFSMTRVKQTKVPLNMHKMHMVRSSCACAKYHLGSPFIHSVAFNHSVSRQWRPWSDCTDEQAI